MSSELSLFLRLAGHQKNLYGRISGMKISRILEVCGAFLIVLVAGCANATDTASSAANISGINHVAGQTVNSFTVNGYGGTLTGNSCCIMLPDKWRPGLNANIAWEVDPQTAGNPPSYSDWDKYTAWEKSLKASFQHHSTSVEIPEYGKACGLTVHFLPCNQIKVTTSCYGYGAPEYTVKEPLNMKEPASCPVN